MISGKKQTASAHIGVFWADIQTGKIYAHKMPVDQGQRYNKTLIVCPDAHIDVWKIIKPQNPAWRDIKNYEDVTRGRVSADISNTPYRYIIVMCSKLHTASFKRDVAREFNLPFKACRFIQDEHYEITEY